MTVLITSIISFLLPIIKFFFELRAGRKLSDQEFMDHIEAHQKKRAGTARQAQDFEDHMQEAYDNMNKKEDPPA